jgi:putative transposase
VSQRRGLQRSFADLNPTRVHRAIFPESTEFKGAGNVHLMPSTYVSLYYHIVFGTKDREPLIAPEWRARFHEYLGGTIRGLDGSAEGVGGMGDHVHLLIGLKASHCLADVVRELKKASSTWVREDAGWRAFAWQEGYAAFTVSATSRRAVQGYIENQQEHHRKKSFREELVEFLDKAEIKFDAKYLD